MLEIAERNGKMDLLPFKDLEAAKEAYDFQNLQSFLDIYYAGCAVLLHEKASPDETAILPSLPPLKAGLV